MTLNYHQEVENTAATAEPAEARTKAMHLLMEGQNALKNHYNPVGEKDQSILFESREVIANKAFNKKTGAFQKFHVIKEGKVVEILDFFYSYDGTYTTVYSHNPNIPKLEE